MNVSAEIGGIWPTDGNGWAKGCEALTGANASRIDYIPFVKTNASNDD
jgi:hypothetical protein